MLSLALLPSGALQAPGKFAMKMAMKVRLTKAVLNKHESKTNRKEAEVQILKEHGSKLDKDDKKALVAKKMAQFGSEGKSVKLTPSEWNLV